MNHDYNPVPRGGDWPAATQHTEPPKKRGLGLKIIALSLAMLLLGGVFAAAGMTFSGWFTDRYAAPETMETEITEPAASPDDALGNNSNAGAPLPALKTFSKAADAMNPSEIYSSYVGCVVAIRTESTYANIFGQSSTYASSGTGFIISDDGYILTNNHVVADATTVTVTLFSGKSYSATVVGADAQNDIAVVHIDAGDLAPVNLGDSDGIITGEDIAVIGNPLGELTNTLTTGIVSAIDRLINIDGTPISMFQIDAAVNSGNSGGPVFDATGRVIGIVSAKSAGSSIEGLGFAIPINDALAVARELVEYGYVTGRPHIGVSVETVSVSTAAYYGVPQGVVVISIESGSPAEKAGMQKSDIITQFGGMEITSRTALAEAKNSRAPGDTVPVIVYRDSAYVELMLTLGEVGAGSQNAQ